MSPLVTYFLAFTAVNILLCWAIYLTYRVGQLHFLVVACMAITAYFSAIAARDWNWPIVLIIFLGIILSAFISFIASLAIANAPCFTVVVVGLSSIIIVKTIIINTDFLGGSIGFFGIPKMTNILPISYIFLVIVGYLIYRIDNSRLGRAASLIFTDKDIATSVGVHTKDIGMLFQIISGAIGGLAGVLYPFLIGSLFPDYFSFGMTGMIMCMLFSGGYSTMWGVLITVPLLAGLPLFFPSNVASWRNLIYACLLITIIMIRPEGLITRRMQKSFQNIIFKNDNSKILKNSE